MRFLKRLRFSTKIGIGTSCIVVVVAVLLAATVGNMASDALIRENKKRGQALVENLAVRAVDPLLADDLLRLRNMIDEVKRISRDVVYAFVLDQRGLVLVHTFQSGFPVELIKANVVRQQGGHQVQLIKTDKEFIYDFAAPVAVGGTRIGAVRLGISKRVIQSVVNQLMMAVAAVAAGSLVVAVFASTLFARRISSRINELKEHAQEIVHGNLDIQAGPFDATPCWEIMDCGERECPAYGDVRRRCWYLPGTMCVHCKDVAYPDKMEACKKCPVYRQNAGDEIQDLAETFDVMAVTLDRHIREIREAEQALRSQQQLMRTILDVTPDLMSLLDENLVYRSPNKAFARSVGLSVEEVVGKTDYDLFPADVADERVRKNREVLETGTRAEMESRREGKKGERWYHTVIIPVYDSEGNINGVLRTARDVTELRVTQEQLIQAQKMESLGKLAGGVAHEINTPLGVILGYAQLLQDDVPQDSQVAEDLRTIEKQTKVCRKIVSDLLGFSRQTESAKSVICLNNTVMEAIALVRHTFTLDQVEIDEDLDDRMPAVYGDADKLKQVWINLLNNARDAMRGGGVIRVRTELDASQGLVRVRVVDTGKGISPEDMQKIFEPFFSTKPVGEGTGLGLAVSFGIIQEHEGKIWAKSPLPEEFGFKPANGDAPTGPGTMFVVELPLDHSPARPGEHPSH